MNCPTDIFWQVLQQFALHVQDEVLYLKGKLMGIAIGTPAPVGQPLNTTFLVAIVDLVARLAGDRDLPAELRHRLAGEPQTAAPLPNTPSMASLPPQKKGKSVTHVSGTICYLCLGSLTPINRRRFSLFPFRGISLTNLFANYLPTFRAIKGRYLPVHSERRSGYNQPG
jgi:hypothetical protein